MLPAKLVKLDRFSTLPVPSLSRPTEFKVWIADKFTMPPEMALTKPKQVRLVSAERSSTLPVPEALRSRLRLGSLIVVSPDRFTVPPDSATTFQLPDIAPRVVS